MQNNLLLWFSSSRDEICQTYQKQRDCVSYHVNRGRLLPVNGFTKCGLPFYGQLSRLVRDLAGIFLNGWWWPHSVPTSMSAKWAQLVLITICPSGGPTKVFPPPVITSEGAVFDLYTVTDRLGSVFYVNCTVWAIQNSLSIPEPLPQPFPDPTNYGYYDQGLPPFNPLNPFPPYYSDPWPEGFFWKKDWKNHPRFQVCHLN